MTRSDINPMPFYYDRYINLVPDIGLIEAFQQSLETLQNLDLEPYHQLGDQVYAEGKWTTRQIFRHLSDWERIFCFRALVTIRDVGASLEPYDENVMADNSKANNHSLEETLNDLIRVRISTISLFNAFDNHDLMRMIQMPTSQIQVLAKAFTIIGHQTHHLNVIEERYMPLLKMS
ncbi:MAG: DinB family protein [Saprospiraceae bacterium]|nr:DinB family protein [Saprospiraceae bacterium]